MKLMTTHFFPLNGRSEMREGEGRGSFRVKRTAYDEVILKHV